MRILVLQAHPRPSTSIVHSALTKAAKAVEGVTVHDLYSAYPDFIINAKAEQELLLSHDLIVMQHPFYWYSSPAILKEWQDIVLDFGWAYGPGGTKLHGRFLMQAISTGGAEGFYKAGARNRFTVEEFLRPFNQTAHLCGMAYLNPFIIYEGRRIEDSTLSHHIARYETLLRGLAEKRTPPLKLLSDGYDLPAAFRAGVTA